LLDLPHQGGEVIATKVDQGAVGRFSYDNSFPEFVAQGRRREFSSFRSFRGHEMALGSRRSAYVCVSLLEALLDPLKVFEEPECMILRITFRDIASRAAPSRIDERARVEPVCSQVR
jgi:hypothetical protein